MTVAFESSVRSPDLRIEPLHDSFLHYRLYSAGVERLATNLYWGEGPQWFGDGRFLLFSDIPNDRILRWDECSGTTSVFRQPSNHANGLARDRQGRLLTCEHGARRVTRTEYDGSISVLADGFGGHRLNSPNDIVCARDGSIWFTDPTFGIDGHWEGAPAAPELPPAVYRIAQDGTLQQVLTELVGPNGLAFSPDERVLYVVESRAKPHRLIWAWDVGTDGALSNKRLHVDADGPGALDGMAVDVDGNLWCGFGSDGSTGAASAGLDGVRVYNTTGHAIGHIHLPERCANVCFGGAKRNRLFMAGAHALYALYVNVLGAA